MKETPYESRDYYIFDRGYNDFKSLYHIHLVEVKFVVGAKKNLKFKTFKWKRKLLKNILSNTIVELTGYHLQSTIWSNFVSSDIGMKNKKVNSFSSQIRWTYPLFRWPNFIRTDGRLSSFSSGSSNIWRLKSFGVRQRTQYVFRFTRLYVPTVWWPSFSMKCSLQELHTKYSKSSASHSQIRLVWETSLNQIIFNMTKTDPTKTVSYLLIFKPSRF